MADGAAPSGKIRVLVLTFAMTAGGSQTFISTMLEHLDRNRFSLELALLYDAESEYRIPSDVGVTKVTCEPTPDWHEHRILSPDFANRWGDWIEIAAQRISSLVRRLNPDIVVCAPEYAAVLAAAAKNEFPPTSHLVGRIGASIDLAFPDTGEAAVYTELAKRAFSEVDCFVAVSSAIAEDLHARLGIARERVAVLHNPVDLSRIRGLAEESVDIEDDHGSGTILFVGRLVRIKGVEYLLHAIAQLEDAKPRCVLVGDGPQRGYLEALAKHLGIANRVDFVGAQENPYRYMSRATVFVLPSLSEGMPNVLLEAMAAGCPVIATDLEGGATRELLEGGECGVLVPMRDEHALASAIRSVLSDAPERERLIAAGLKRVGCFDPDSTVTKYAETLERVARGEFTAPARREISESVPSQAEAQARGSESGEGTTQVAAKRASARPTLVARGASIARRTLRRAASALTGSRGVPSLSADSARVVADLADSRGTQGRVRVVVLGMALDSGARRASAELLMNELDRDAFEVVLVTESSPPAGLRIPTDVRCLTLLEFGGDTSLDPGALRVALAPDDGSTSYVEWLAASAGKLAQLTGMIRADVIVAEGYDAALPALLARRHLRPGAPVVVHMHSRLAEIGTVGAGVIVADVLRRYLCDADGVFVADADAASEMTEAGGVPRDRVRVIPDPVTVEAWGQGGADAAPGIALGANPGRRNVVMLVDAETASAASSAFRSVALAGAKQEFDVLVGAPGSELPGIKEMALREGFTDGSLRFEVGEAVPSNALEGASAVVLWSDRVEGAVPGAVVRAMQAGRPVIAAGPSASAARLLDGGAAGLLVPIANPEDLAEAILQVLWDDQTGCELGERGRERAELMVASRIASRAGAYLRSVVDTPGRVGT